MDFSAGTCPNRSFHMKLVRKIQRSLVLRTILNVVFLLAIYTIIVSVIGYIEVTDALLDQYADGAFRTAGIAAHTIEPDKIDSYINSGGEGEEYELVQKRLTQICNASGSMFVYVIMPDRTDYKHITFLFSTMNQEGTFTQYEFGYVRETSNADYAEKYRRICEDYSARELVVRERGYIETNAHITAMSPLFDDKGEVRAILCVQRQMDELNKARNSYVAKIFAAMIVLVLGVIIGLSLRINRSLMQPIRKISAEATRFAKENDTASVRLKEEIKNQDEIGELAGAIDQMEEQIQNYVQNLTQITAEKERISTEMGLASRIQSDMLPNSFPAFPDREDFDIYASMDPAREIGGDFYHFFLLDEDHLCLIIADVSGKGVPAALFMMASIITLTNIAKMGEKPSEILRIANDAICATNREEMFVSVWLGILELSTGKMIASNAGHEYPVICHAGGRFEILKDKHNFIIGGLQNCTYKDYEIDMKPGSKLFLYTDGVPEATDDHQNMFGLERTVDALNENPDADPKTLIENVRRWVDVFVGGAEQFDDLTMLCLEYKGNERC